MENIEQQIINAKNFIFENNNNSNCRFVWYGATETIKEYVEALEWTNVNSALTVCSSRDHMLNLINKGVKK